MVSFYSPDLFGDNFTMKKLLLILTFFTSYKLIFSQDKPSNFREQLNLGEILRLNSDESTKKDTLPLTNSISSMEDFLKNGQAYLAEKNKNKRKAEIKLEPKILNHLTSETNIQSQKIFFQDFQKCALKSLPIVKHLLGKTLLSSSPSEIDNDYINLFEISDNLLSDLKNGQLICGPFLGNEMFLVFLEGEAKQFLSDQAIFLSIVSRINDPHSFSTAWIMTAFTQGFNKDATNNDFWKIYWKYLSLEILIKNNFYFMSPDEFSMKILNKEWDKAKKQQLEEVQAALKEI